ncbi:MAG: hypothetical protein IJQ63_09660 [Synergistaceae bacterium]|nr:hypothetical protein [Synergistaceae bacterium]
MAREKDTLVAFRLTRDKAREFKAQCVLEGTSIQDVLEQAVESFMKSVKEKAE